MSGRPKKYVDLVNDLEDEKLYTPAMIAREAATAMSSLEKQERKTRMMRIRITMARFASKHRFPDQGDGIVTLRGQAPTPGWYGWRWKQTYGHLGPNERGNHFHSQV